MVIARSPCSGGPLWEGNRPEEADWRSGFGWSARWVNPTDCERASPSVSEPDSASLVKVSAAKLP